jgi:hypothetical protein
MRRGNPRRRRGRRLPGEWPYFFLAPFFAGFFAAFFVAIGTPPPFSLEISFIVLFHIAEIAPLVKFFFSFFVFTVLALPLLYPISFHPSHRGDQNFSDFQKASGDSSEFHHNENLHSNPSMNCP